MRRSATTDNLDVSICRLSLGSTSTRRRPLPALVLALLLGSLLTTGCWSTAWLQRRGGGGEAWHLPLVSSGSTEPSERTMLLLRRFDLAEDFELDPHALLASLDTIVQREPSPDKRYAHAELAFLAGKRLEANDEKKAFDLYVTSATSAYRYLFDDKYLKERNTYDPQFRGACDLYNRSLDHALRLVSRHGGLKPGLEHECQSGDRRLQLKIVSRSPHLQGHDFETFELVSSYEIQGLPNRYRTFGLGVPLIAQRRHRKDASPVERHYPQGLSVPMTAFLRIPSEEMGDAKERKTRQVVLELYDPLVTETVEVAGRAVPLESDSTTPLAFFLDRLDYTDMGAATSGLIWPDETPEAAGLSMLEPYQPGKIPVLLVHGIWSTPITWVEMFNDLRSIPEIRERYQFWFYFYPTGQPFMVTAAELRNELHRIRKVLDPHRSEPALDQMVLIGHSMGGLIAKLQTIESGDAFWKQAVGKPIDEVEIDDATRATIERTFFFHPNRSIGRVVTVGTPHRGTFLSNSTTQWLGRRFFTPPRLLNQVAEQLHLQNPDLLDADDLNLNATSIESLAPNSPPLVALLNAQRAPWVTYHNIIGRRAKGRYLGTTPGDDESDGVVTVASARSPGTTSELVVVANHQEVHRNPNTVLEIRRILLEHLAATRRSALPQLPTATPK